MKASLWLSSVLCAATLLSAQTNSKPAATPRKAARKSATITADEVSSLRNALAAQQRQVDQQREQMDQLKSHLQQLLDAIQQANANAQKAQTSVDQVQARAAQAQQSSTEAQRLADQASANAAEATTAMALVTTKTQDQGKQLSALQSLVGRFRFNGDIRIRGESFNQQGVPDRNRARIRVRFGLDGQLNEDFTAGFSLATGSLGDPTTTNETLTNVFDRKTIGLDRAYVTYNPIAHNWLSLTGGKFAYQWQRTAVTGDPDINPEGFDEKFSFNFEHPVVNNFTFHAIQLLYNESNIGAGSSGVSGQDSYALGGQVSARLQIGPWTATPSFLTLKWNRPDAILQQSAFAVAATTTGSAATATNPAVGPFPVPGEGQGCAKGLNLPAFAPCVFSPNGMTNATYVDSKGVPHFYSGFNYADFILNNQIKTGATRWPINLILEFEDNLDAENHPLDAKGKVIKSLGSQNKEYGADFNVGQTRNKNDIQIGYAWLREEQDAAIASFAESDQRAPTNLLQNRFYALWKLRTNTLASFTWWHGRVLNSNLENNAALVGKTITKAGQEEPYLNRMQFDLIYAF